MKKLASLLLVLTLLYVEPMILTGAAQTRYKVYLDSVTTYCEGTVSGMPLDSTVLYQGKPAGKIAFTGAGKGLVRFLGMSYITLQQSIDTAYMEIPVKGSGSTLDLSFVTVNGAAGSWGQITGITGQWQVKRVYLRDLYTYMGTADFDSFYYFDIYSDNAEDSVFHIGDIRFFAAEVSTYSYDITTQGTWCDGSAVKNPDYSMLKDVDEQYNGKDSGYLSFDGNTKGIYRFLNMSAIKLKRYKSTAYLEFAVKGNGVTAVLDLSFVTNGGAAGSWGQITGITTEWQMKRIYLNSLFDYMGTANFDSLYYFDFYRENADGAEFWIGDLNFYSDVPEPQFESGDMNRDGIIDTEDIIAGKRQVLKLDSLVEDGAFTACDMNDDQVITVADLIALKHLMVENYKKTVTVNPVETDEALTNPGMGWLLIDTAFDEYIDAGSSGDYPLVSYVTIMSSWNELEPEEGIYDWSLVDRAIDEWSAKGKHIKFRISTDDFPYYYTVARGVPDWLIDLGVPFEYNYYEYFVLRYPDANNQLYQAKLRNFMTAFVEKYGDNPHLTLVDLRGYGLWGEWHSGYVYDTEAERKSALKAIFDIWYDAWSPKKMLSMNYSHEWRSFVTNGNTPSTYEEYLAYSIYDYALTKDNICWEREGFYGAMEPNEWRLNAETFQDGKLQVAEIAGGYTDLVARSLEDDIDHHAAALDECLLGHPNFITIFGWDKMGSAHIFYRERQDLIKKGLINMGYRFVPYDVTYHPEVRAGETTTVSLNLKNLAVGRCHEDAALELSLWDNTGGKASSALSDIKLFDVIKDSDASGNVEISVPAGLKGQFTLKASIVDKAGNPVIKMPLKGRDSKMYCPIGSILVK